MKSSCTLSDLLSELVNYLINKKGNEDLGSVSDASIINPCNDVISICVVAHESKDPIRPSQAEIIDLNPSNENLNKGKLKEEILFKVKCQTWNTPLVP